MQCFHSFDSSATVTIQVGSATDPRTLLVHKSFLTAWSEFFSRALNGDWKESETHTVDLTEDVPETFDMYLNLVYKNDLPVMTLDEDKLCALDTLEFLKHICKQYISLIHLYVLADKLQDIQAKNEALKAILQISYLRNHQGICIRLPPVAIRKIYDCTPQGSSARSLCIDLMSDLKVEHLQKYVATRNIPDEFITDLALAPRRELPATMENVAKRKGAATYLETVNSPQ